jgi:hypothetical protein
MATPSLAQAAHAICLWLSGLRAKQGMLRLLAHEVRPCLVYGEAVLELVTDERCLAFNIFDALPLHTVAVAYSGPIKSSPNIPPWAAFIGRPFFYCALAY